MSENHLAIANVPVQQWGELYTQEEALAAAQASNNYGFNLRQLGD